MTLLGVIAKHFCPSFLADINCGTQPQPCLEVNASHSHQPMTSSQKMLGQRSAHSQMPLRVEGALLVHPSPAAISALLVFRQVEG